MATRASLTIDKPIGQRDDYAGVFGYESFSFSPSDMAEWITENQEADEFEIKIRSNGGCVTSGFDIYDQLRALAAAGKKIITIGHKVNSIATVIFLAGDERKLAKHAEFIIHNPWYDGSAWGFTAEEAQRLADELRESEDKIKNFYVERLGLDEARAAEIAELMQKDTDLGSEKALSYGFATEILAVVASYQKNAPKPFAFTPRIAAQIKANKDDMNKDTKELKEKVSGLEALLTKINNAVTKMIGSRTKAEVTTLADETKVYHDGELAVGVEVFSDEAMTSPLADGTYTVSDGRSITVASGKVTEIREAAAEAGEMAALKAENENLKKQLETSKTTIDGLAASVKDAATTLSEIKKQFVPGDDTEEPDDRKPKRGHSVAARMIEIKNKTKKTN